MIRVERDQLDEDGKPIRPSESWFQRASDATAKAATEGVEHEVSDLYRDDELRRALERLFHRKCAYCESRLGTVGPEEVEHYRPKGGIAERREHPGYYWLAYAWDNLYPACTYCNQKRRDRPSWHEPATGPVAGKATLFPLENESERAMSPDADLGMERPLLIAPCEPKIDPEQHFRYDVRGAIHPLNPTDVRAQATIRVCHLWRRRLRLDRARVIKRTVKLSKVLDRLHARLGSRDPDTLEVQQLLSEQLRDDALHAGAARYVLRDPTAFAR